MMKELVGVRFSFQQEAGSPGEGDKKTNGSSSHSVEESECLAARGSKLAAKERIQVYFCSEGSMMVENK